MTVALALIVLVLPVQVPEHPTKRDETDPPGECLEVGWWCHTGVVLEIAQDSLDKNGRYQNRESTGQRWQVDRPERGYPNKLAARGAGVTSKLSIYCPVLCNTIQPRSL